jgi:hypothetical protein
MISPLTAHSNEGMTDTTTTEDTIIDLSDLGLQLTNGSERVQQQLIHKLSTLGNAGEAVLMEFLLQRSSVAPTWIDGNAYQVLSKTDSARGKRISPNSFS